MADPSSSGLASNNPFRRKLNNTSGGLTPPAPPIRAPDIPSSLSSLELPPSDQFRTQLQALPQSTRPPPTTSFQKPKVVKKVRVQSPPPSSPESSSGALDHYRHGTSRDDYDETSSNTDEDDEEEDEDEGDIRDPFGGSIEQARSIADAYEEASPSVSAEQLPQVALNTRPPSNPFQKTLEDLEQGGAREAVAQSTSTAVPVGAVRGGAPLDVDAFRRLLLTGQVGGVDNAATLPLQPSTSSVQAPQNASSHPIATATHATADGSSITDASSVSRQSIFDPPPPAIQDTPRTSHEISEQEVEDEKRGLIGYRPKMQRPPSTPGMLRKKPPPPSSRHGKLIKTDMNSGIVGEGRSARPSSLSGRPTTPLTSPSAEKQQSPLSDVNKPLPPAPTRSSTGEQDEPESIFDREAAGKVPEREDADSESIVSSIVSMPPPPRPPTPPGASHALLSSTSNPSFQPGTTPTSAPPASPQQPLSRKPAPPPPSRRQPGHARSESRVSISGAQQQPQSPQHEELPSPLDPMIRRSSVESTRSRSSSLRVSVHAPAPPPPRRSNHGAIPSGNGTATRSATAPTASTGSIGGMGELQSPRSDLALPDVPSPLSIGSASGLGIGLGGPLPGQEGVSASPGPVSPSPVASPAGLVGADGDASGKLGSGLQQQHGGYGHVRSQSHSGRSAIPPPPPPARNLSMRTRKPGAGLSGSSSRLREAAALGGNGVASHHPPPPPPPSRQRGSSKGSIQSIESPSPPPPLLAGSGSRVGGARDISGGGNSSRSGSFDLKAAGAGPGALVDEPGPAVGEPTPATQDLLADLTRLQREVDALRGKYESASSPSAAAPAGASG